MSVKGMGIMCVFSFLLKISASEGKYMTCTVKTNIYTLQKK